MGRDCLDHVIVLNDRHLHRVLSEYISYYNESRTHLGIEKDCPVTREIEDPGAGEIVALPVLHLPVEDERDAGDDLLVVRAMLHLLALGEEAPLFDCVEVDGAQGQKALRAQAGEQVLALDDEDELHGCSPTSRTSRAEAGEFATNKK